MVGSYYSKYIKPVLVDIAVKSMRTSAVGSTMGVSLQNMEGRKFIHAGLKGCGSEKCNTSLLTDKSQILRWSCNSYIQEKYIAI